MENAGTLAKLIAPESQRVLSRQRLYDLIDSPAHAAVWISGPPGSGKTTLASSYLAASKAMCGWYKLDEGDAEPASFFHFLSQLASSLQPSEFPPLPPLTPDRLPGLAVYARTAFRALYAHISSPFLLIFDDFHVLPSDSPTGQLLRIAIEEVPAGSHILVLSREPPPALFAGLELYGRLATLGWSDLQFDESEARQLVRICRGEGLDELAFQALQRRTRGWVTGWILLLSQVERDWDTNDDEGYSYPSLQILFDYFSAELFEQQPTDLQRFLMETSFLPYLTADTASALTGADHADQILAQLLGRQFITRHTGGGVNSFEYHDLYRSFLQQEAEKRLGMEVLAALKHRVATVLEEHGKAIEAISYYAGQGDWPAVVRLAHEHIPMMVAQGRTARVQAWLSELPPDILENCPWLSYWWGISSFPSAMEQAQQHLETAHRGFVDRDDTTGMLLTAAGIIDILAFSMTDVRPMTEWLKRILVLIPKPELLPADPAGAQAATAVLTGYTLREPWHSDVMKWRDRAVELTAQFGDPMLQARTLHMSAFSAAMREETDAIERYAQRLLVLADTPLMAPTVNIFSCLGEVYLHIFHADWDAVLVAVEKGLHQAIQADVHFLDVILLCNGAIAAIYSNRNDVLDTYTKQLSATLELQMPWDRSFTGWVLGLAAYGRGEYQVALEHSRGSMHLVESVGVIYPVFWARSLVVQSLCALDRFTEAWDNLMENERLVGTSNCQLLIHENHLLKAYVLSVSGRHAEAETELRDVWDEWITHGQSYFYSLQLPVTRHLGMLALSIGIDPNSIKALFDRFGLEPEGDARLMEVWPWPLKIYTLGRFSIVREGIPLKFTGKAQKKPLELLKALIAFGGRGVSQERLAEALWPDAEGDSAMRVSSTTLYRLRKLLGDERLIVVSDNSVTLDARFCWVDAWAFERTLREGRAGSERALQWAIALYKGHFLDINVNDFWVLRPRERLRTRYVGAIRGATRILCEHERCEEARELAEQGLAIDDLVEEFYVSLMKCYQCLGQHVDALNTYKRCEQRLQDMLGVMPSPHTRELYRSLQNEVDINT